MNDSLAVLTGVLGGIIAFFLVKYLTDKKLPRAYSIAVVGYPQAGKTFLITSMFGELFSNRVSGVKTVLRGKNTIEKVNGDLALIDMGKKLGPTTDQDLFAYRTDLIRGRFPFNRRYKVEIGDFPGEDSHEFAEKFGNWFHETPYFKWVMEADAFVFVVDLAPLLSSFDSDDYTAQMTRAIRAAWQHILEYHVEGNKNLRAKPVVIVFTKADLLARYREIANDKSVTPDAISSAISKFGFETIEVEKTDADVRLDAEMTEEIKEKFSGIIDYLKSQSGEFHIEFVSALIRTRTGRLGVKSFISHILPR